MGEFNYYLSALSTGLLSILKTQEVMFLVGYTPNTVYSVGERPHTVEYSGYGG